MKKSLTLRQKTWIFITIVIVISIAVNLFLTHYLYERFYIEKQLDLLKARGDLLTELYYDDDETKAVFLDRVEWMNKCAEANVLWTDHLPYLLNGKDGLNLITLDESKLLQNGESLTIIQKQSSFEKPIIGVAVPILDEEDCLVGVIFLYRTLVEVFEPFQATRYLIFFGFIIWVIFIIYVVRRVMNKITFPLENMRLVSEKMANGHFSERINVTSNDEIGSLSNSFNCLAEALENEEQKRREFLSNASHELRTPLCSIRGYSEAILDGVVDNPKEFLEIINKESERMNRLVNDLLDLAQLEGDSYPMKEEPIPFSQLILDIVPRYEKIIRDKNILITTDLDDDAVIIGDFDRITQVICNLLDNAFCYSEEGMKIDIVSKITSEGVELIITDYGQGIPKEEIPKLIERFHRVDKARSRKAGGTGLGLSIVSEILKKHHASLLIQSEINRGTSVKIVFSKWLK